MTVTLKKDGLPEKPLADDPEKLVSTALEAWKTTVGVQQHFNDLELRIRNFAITFAGAILGLAGLALKEDPKSHLPAALLTVGLIGWAAFYVMDRLWYHRFLDAATEHARNLETWLRAATGTEDWVFNLAGGIKEKSGISLASKVGWWSRLIGRFYKGGKLRSRHRIDIFYAAFLIASGVLVFVFYRHAEPKREPPPPMEIILKGDAVKALSTLAPPSSPPGPAVVPGPSDGSELTCSPANGL
jgi:hypothetical protein